MRDLEFQGQKIHTRLLRHFLNFRTLIESTHGRRTQVSTIFILYQRYHIESVSTLCLTLNFKVKGQGHNINLYIFNL